MAAPVNYTTRISAAKTAAEMQGLLAAHGASSVSLDFDKGSPTALRFVLRTSYDPQVDHREFFVPVDVVAMQQLLEKEDEAGRLKSGAKADRTSYEQAERVAWRVMKTWLEAQLALVATRMVDFEEVFLPYMIIGAGSATVYQQYVASQALPIEPPED